MTPRHRARELQQFLTLIDRNVPSELAVHVVLDNVATHRTAAIQRWLRGHPRFTFHFTPTYSSWMNLVERWFAELTTKWLRRGTHHSVVQGGLGRRLERAPAPLRLAQDRRPASSTTSPDILIAFPTQDTRRRHSRVDAVKPHVRSGPRDRALPLAQTVMSYPTRERTVSRSIAVAINSAARSTLDRPEKGEVPKQPSMSRTVSTVVPPVTSSVTSRLAAARSSR